MKLGVLILLTVLARCNSHVVNYDSKAVNDIFMDEWESFKAMYGKTYENEVEESFRLKVYMENRHKIAQHNQRGLHYQIGLNAFGDMLYHEFSSVYNGFRAKVDDKEISFNTSTFIAPANYKLPDSIDWRTLGAVTEVKDQKACGSCWSFGATGSLEGQQFRKSGELTSLSEEDLVDCATVKYNCHGCEGGDPLGAYLYLRDNGGIDTEASYPYVGRDQICKFSAGNVGAIVTGVVRLPQGDERKLQEAVASTGPVVVAIHAQESLMRYTNGIYYDESCSSDPNSLNHAVLVVGYGTENDQDYWLVKNSWGTFWGENGYIKMSRGRNNNCGISTYAGYPLL